MAARNLPLLAVLVLSSWAVVEAAEPTRRLVQVSGLGVVEVPPDQVAIQVIVTTVDDDLIRVRENSEKDALSIVNCAKKHGADEKGFRVSELKLSLAYNEQLRRQIYKEEREVTIELNDLTRLDPLLLDLLREKNLKVKDVAFTVSKPRPHEFQALKQAVDNAKEKAEHLAGLSGLKLGKVLAVRVRSEYHGEFAMSMSMGSVQRTTPQRDTERATAQAVEPFAGSKPLPGKGFYFVAAERPLSEKRDEGKAGTRPFALGLIDITAEVDVDFELLE